MSFHLILPFFPEELRELLLDPSISDLMINGTTGVYADRGGVVEHIPLATPYTNDRLAGRDRARRPHPRPRPYQPESHPQYTPAGWLPCRSRRRSLFHPWTDAHHPQIQSLVYVAMN